VRLLAANELPPCSVCTVFWPEVFGSHAGFSPTRNASFLRDRMRSYPAERGLGGREKDALLARFAELLTVDYDEITARVCAVAARIRNPFSHNLRTRLGDVQF